MLDKYSKYVKNLIIKFKEKYKNLVLGMLLIIAFLLMFLSGCLKGNFALSVISIILLGLLGVTVYKVGFDTNRNFENKCKQFGCEFLILYSKEDIGLKERYDKLLSILEQWKLGYYVLMIPIYISFFSFNTLNNNVENKFESNLNFTFNLIIVLVWIISRQLINKILLIESALKYESKFTSEFLVDITEIAFTILILSISSIYIFHFGSMLTSLISKK